MAVPKSKVSKQRRNKRRSSVWKLETPGVTTCPISGQKERGVIPLVLFGLFTSPRR